MAKAYSLDIREKVLCAYNKSRTKDKYKIAKRFDVSYDFVNNLMNLYNETGSLEPRVRKGKRPPRLSEENLEFLKLTVKANNDSTLTELCETLFTEKGVKVGTTVMFRALKKLNLTLKKSHLNQISGIPAK